MDGALRNMTSVYLRDGERILLLYRQGGRVVSEVWTGSAGGHFEKDELNDARACVLREMNEELGLAESDIENLALRYITLRRAKGEIRQNYFFFADLKSSVSRELTSNEGKTKWFSLDETAALEMPYSAKFVMEHYRKTGKATDALYVGTADGNGVVFTALPEY